MLLLNKIIGHIFETISPLIIGKILKISGLIYRVVNLKKY